MHLQKAASYLKKHGIKNPEREAEWLLSELLGVKRSDLFSGKHFKIPEDEWQSWLKLRAQGTPIAYITGSVTFLNCSLKITPAVLIPRQETELLAEKIVQDLQGKDYKGKKLWDLCTGSGCLGIAIKKQLPELEVTLSDISKGALAVARSNAKLNLVDVTCLQGDLFAPFTGMQADFIVSNPPYVTEQEYETLDPEVKKEPKGALVAGERGLTFYQRIAQDLPKFLKNPGKLWLEMGAGQGEEIKKIFGNGTVEKDYSLHDRFFSLELQ